MRFSRVPGDMHWCGRKVPTSIRLGRKRLDVPPPANDNDWPDSIGRFIVRRFGLVDHDAPTAHEMMCALHRDFQHERELRRRTRCDGKPS